MKVFYFLLVVICFSFFESIAQEDKFDRYKNKRFFGIAQASFVKNYHLDQTVRLPSGGGKKTELDSKGSFGGGIDFIGGYYIIKKRLSLGTGIGMQFYKDPDFKIIPVFADLRFYLSNRPNVAYFLMDVGGSVQAGDTFKNGDFFKFGFGYRGFVGDTFCMTAELSWQPFGVSNDGKPISSSDDDYGFKGVCLTVGVVLF